MDELEVTSNGELRRKPVGRKLKSIDEPTQLSIGV
jgi:hypothetical protein